MTATVSKISREDKALEIRKALFSRESESFKALPPGDPIIDEVINGIDFAAMSPETGGFILDAIKAMVFHRKLVLKNCGVLTNAMLRGILVFSTVKELVLDGCNFKIHWKFYNDQWIKENILEVIASGAPWLESLSILNMPHIKNLSAVEVSLLRLQVLDLSGMSGIQSIELGPQKIKDKIHYSKLYAIDLTDCAGINDAALRHLISNSPNIRQLYLDGSGVSHAAFKHKFPKLSLLSDNAIAAIEGLSESLDFHDKKVDVEVLLSAINHYYSGANAKLEELDLSNLKIDDPAAEILADIISRNSLETLCLTNTNISRLGMNHITQALSGYQSISEFICSDLDSAGLQSVFMSLLNTNIRSLTLSSNEELSVVSDLVTLIKTSKNLKFLSLGQTKINNDEYVHQIILALNESSSLREFSFGAAKISLANLDVLAAVLKMHKSIVSIDCSLCVGENNIVYQVAFYGLIKALNYNIRITSFLLPINVGPWVSDQVAVILQRHTFYYTILEEAKEIAGQALSDEVFAVLQDDQNPLKAQFVSLADHTSVNIALRVFFSNFITEEIVSSEENIEGVYKLENLESDYNEIDAQMPETIASGYDHISGILCSVMNTIQKIGTMVLDRQNIDSLLVFTLQLFEFKFDLEASGAIYLPMPIPHRNDPFGDDYEGGGGTSMPGGGDSNNDMLPIGVRAYRNRNLKKINSDEDGEHDSDDGYDAEIDEDENNNHEASSSGDSPVDVAGDIFITTSPV